MKRPISPARAVVRYLLYVLSCAMILFCLFALRTGFLAFVSLLFTEDTGFTALSRARVLDITALLLLGIGATVGIVALDSWYAEGQRRGVLGRRFVRLTGALVVGLGISHAATWLAAGGGATPGLVITAVELTGGTALVVVPALRRRA